MYYYVLVSRWVQLKCSITTQYASQDSTTSFTTTTRYSYDTLQTGHLQVSQIRTQRSDGSTQLKVLTYPADYPQVTTGALAAMRSDSLFQHAAVVESLTQIYPAGRASGSPQTTAGSYTTYSRPTATSKYLPAVTSELPLVMPTAARQLAAPALPAAGQYTPKARLRYHPATANLLTSQLVGDAPTSYLWGYEQTLPIAEAKKALPAALAATSFEPTATGRWLYDSTGTHRVAAAERTGRWVYRLDATGSIRRDQLPAGEYELTYWQQGSTTPLLTLTNGSIVGGSRQVTATAGDWHCFRTRLRLTDPGAVQLRAQAGDAFLLDEVRLYPVGTLLTTFTYDPLVGVTSQTDPAGRTTFYEYDGLGRLVGTRDEQGRILSQQQYHYAGQ